MAKLIITKKENGEFRFSLLNDKNLMILMSKPFSTRTACLKGIEMLKTSITNNTTIERLIGGKGKPYFNIKTETISSLAKSSLYDNDAKREEGIKQLLNELPSAKLDFVKEEKKKEAVEAKTERPNKNSDADFAPKNKPNKKKSHYN